MLVNNLLVPKSLLGNVVSLLKQKISLKKWAIGQVSLVLIREGEALGPRNGEGQRLGPRNGETCRTRGP